MTQCCDYTDCRRDPEVRVEFTAPQSNGLRGHYCREHAEVALGAFPTRVASDEKVPA